MNPTRIGASSVACRGEISQDFTALQLLPPVTDTNTKTKRQKDKNVHQSRGNLVASEFVQCQSSQCSNFLFSCISFSQTRCLPQLVFFIAADKISVSVLYSFCNRDHRSPSTTAAFIDLILLKYVKLTFPSAVSWPMIPGFHFQCSFRDTPVSNAPKIPTALDFKEIMMCVSP